MSVQPCITSEKALSPMRLVVYSPYFHPRLGGLETVVQVLASEWARMGHEVTVITDTSNVEPDVFSFHVLRRPGLLASIAAYRAADAVILANISLWGLLPLLFCGSRRPPWIATHHIWYENPGHRVKPFDRLKKVIARFADSNISVSHAVDDFLSLQGHVIPNPYDNFLFRRLPDVTKDRELVFLGRLVSDKGCDMLLDAIAALREHGWTPNLSIIGSGPAMRELEDQVQRLQIASQVRFTGPQSGEELVRLLNEHRFMVVPSRWDEPFGVVALEGIACGCAVIGSSGGGLPEAIGACGATFPNGDVHALASILLQALTGSLHACTEPVTVQNHLMLHDPERIARQYLGIIQDSCRNDRVRGGHA